MSGGLIVAVALYCVISTAIFWVRGFSWTGLQSTLLVAAFAVLTYGGGWSDDLFDYYLIVVLITSPAITLQLLLTPVRAFINGPNYPYNHRWD